MYVAGEAGADAVSDTLELMRNGQLTTRPGWENVHTSLVPAPADQKPPTTKTMVTTIEYL